MLAPSCVPAVPKLESTGASFGAKEVGEILDMDNVVGIAEIMDFVGVYQAGDRMHSIIDEGIKRGMYLQGHAPYVSGKELAARAATMRAPRRRKWWKSCAAASM